MDHRIEDLAVHLGAIACGNQAGCVKLIGYEDVVKRVRGVVAVDVYAVVVCKLLLPISSDGPLRSNKRPTASGRPQPEINFSPLLSFSLLTESFDLVNQFLRFYDWRRSTIQPPQNGSKHVLEALAEQILALVFGRDVKTDRANERYELIFRWRRITKRFLKENLKLRVLKGIGHRTAVASALLLGSRSLSMSTSRFGERISLEHPAKKPINLLANRPRLKPKSLGNPAMECK